MRHPERLRDRAWLLRASEKRTVKEIAREVQMQPNCVRYWLKRHGIAVKREAA